MAKKKQNEEEVIEATEATKAEGEMHEAPEGDIVEEVDEGEPEAHDTKARPVTRHVRVELTQEEKIKAGQELAEALQRVEVAEYHKKAAVSQYKAEEEAAKTEAAAKLSLVRNGYEFRDVRCSEVSDWTTGRVQVIRDDTGETIEDREMRENERQIEIPCVDSKDAEKLGDGETTGAEGDELTTDEIGFDEESEEVGSEALPV